MPSAVPNYLSTDADGAANATFAGGISITAATVGTPPPQRQVRWIAESDGSVIAYIAGADVRVPDLQRQLTLGTGPVGNSTIGLLDGQLGAKGALWAFIAGAGGGSSVTVVDSEGASDFVRTFPGTAAATGWVPVASPGAPLPDGVPRVGIARCTFAGPLAAGDTVWAGLPNLSGLGTYGCHVIETAPDAHWNFIVHPRANDIVIRNMGAAQNLTLRVVLYYVPSD